MDTFYDRDVDAWVALFAEDAVIHDPFLPEPSRDREAIENVERAVLRAFRDIQWRQLRPAIDVGDRVAVELAVNAVNDGPLEMHDGELPATGRAISFETGVFGLIILRRTGVAAQLGITP